MIIPYRERKPTGVVTQALTQPFALKVFQKQGVHIEKTGKSGLRRGKVRLATRFAT
jgi:hypothetical protein